MAAIGIVCEYNPFHRGHAWHISRSRSLAGGDDAVVCVMSGDYVQRGEAASFSKFARAEAACRCGADLVAELPLPWCLSSAESFARGAVTLLAGLGAERLSFGAETQDLAALREMADTLSEPETQQQIRDRLAQTPKLSYAQARQQLMAERVGAAAKLLSEPNCILAVEYLKAIRQEQLALEPMAVLRRGSGHDETAGERGFLSAAAIRAMLRRDESIRGEVPDAALSVYLREKEAGFCPSPDRLETALLSRLRMLDLACFEALPDAGEGMGRRLYRAVREENGIEAILDAASASRYTRARLRRALLCAGLGIDRQWTARTPPYARILAMNRRGREHLAALREREQVPTLIKPAAVRRLSGEAERLFALGAAAHDFYALCCGGWQMLPPGEDWRRGPLLVEDED